MIPVVFWEARGLFFSGNLCNYARVVCPRTTKFGTVEQHVSRGSATTVRPYWQVPRGESGGRSDNVVRMYY